MQYFQCLQYSLDSQPADALVGRKLLFNWAAVGWYVGTITRRNKDVRRKLDEQPYNFLVYYDVDDQEALHVLELDTFVSSSAEAAEAPLNAWALLEAESGPGGSSGHAGTGSSGEDD